MSSECRLLNWSFWSIIKFSLLSALIIPLLGYAVRYIKYRVVKFRFYRALNKYDFEKAFKIRTKNRQYFKERKEEA